jgi:hypothetical protein
MTDNINPDHYKHGGIETFDIIKAKQTQEETIGYCKGNQRKYLDRRGLKNAIKSERLAWAKQCKEECRKQKWYLDEEEKIYDEIIAEEKATPIYPDELMTSGLDDED